MKKVMLSGILENDNIGKIYDENEINTQFNDIKLRNGIYITEDSRKDFINIIKICTGVEYKIDENGYLEYYNLKTNDSIVNMINNTINSYKTIVISINDTYESMIQDVVYNFMIERTLYSQVFDYNDNIKVALINPEKVKSRDEELTEKETYEKILFNIFAEIY